MTPKIYEKLQSTTSANSESLPFVSIFWDKEIIFK